VLRLAVVGGADPVLELTGTGGGANDIANPPPGPVHGALRVSLAAGGLPVILPASVLAFTDGSGQDREVSLPAVTVLNGQTVAWWIAEGGASFADPSGGSPGAAADFTNAVAEPAAPWAVKQSGFRVDRVATGLQLPVNVAFLPNPGAGPDDPYYYVTELYGAIKVVSRSGAVSDYATDLLDFDPFGSFPGSGEKGMTGIAVDPASGDVFVGTLFEVSGDPNVHFPEVVRLHSEDGGHTAATRTPILQLPNEPMGPSHQISNVSIGPDGKLYVHIGDGLYVTPAQDLTSARGKILRMGLDGSAPADNPFFSAADGITATDYVFAYGFRNPFGGAWREADGAHWEAENGPSIDRLAKVVAGRNYLYDGTDPSMQNFAAYTWTPSHAPVNIAFVQLSTFAGSGFPSDKLNHAYVTESGPTYAPGPQELGKRVAELVVDGAGNLIAGPLPLVEYVGAGRGTATALAAGPDGLYFADLYKDFGAANPTDRGASVFRIRWTGVADFSAESPAGPAPLAVSFQETSSVPAASAWHWEFGDGGQSDEREPTHVYDAPGAYDVRLTVTGSGGQTARQKSAFVTVGPPARDAVRAGAGRPTPLTLPPRPDGVRALTP
ncbi:MAG: PQQ-dependent sugar dehydrogenase, partial [Thermoanaerobaculia bacterium]